MTNKKLREEITRLLCSDPVCFGRVSSATIDAIAALSSTDSQSVGDYDDEDMAAVGRSLMEAIKDYGSHPLLKGWSPGGYSPSEIVGDLLNAYDEKEPASPAVQSEPSGDDVERVKAAIRKDMYGMWPIDGNDVEDCIRIAAEAAISAMSIREAGLREALIQHNDRLRSAMQIANRNGADTNWLAFRGQCQYTLAEFHDIVNDARAALNAGGDRG